MSHCSRAEKVKRAPKNSKARVVESELVRDYTTAEKLRIIYEELRVLEKGMKIPKRQAERFRYIVTAMEHLCEEEEKNA